HLIANATNPIRPPIAAYPTWCPVFREQVWRVIRTTVCDADNVNPPATVAIPASLFAFLPPISINYRVAINVIYRSQRGAGLEARPLPFGVGGFQDVLHYTCLSYKRRAFRKFRLT